MLLNLNTNIDNQLAGYRLERLEVLNWGTFDRQVWDIHPRGRNSLLTGDIGSGKSTLVDAITTLLVPHQKITYNKAAGADSRERNLRTYIRGAYKNEKVERSNKARDVYLRPDGQSYSVLLAVFANEGLAQQTTLAQVFWLLNDQVRKFYVLAHRPLNIVDHFSDFGKDILRLKKKLRQDEDIQVFNTFTDYAIRFRQTFGIQQPEALDLFYQTVSMKSVGNLTDFVREQMLGETNIQQNIDELVNRYRDLTDAHKAVQTARDQFELLQPLVTEADQWQRVQRKIESLEAIAEELPRHFAHLRIRALQRQLDTLHGQWRENRTVDRRLRDQLQQRRQEQQRLYTALAGLDESRRLEQIRAQRETLGRERDRRQANARTYSGFCRRLDETTPGEWHAPTDRAAFLRNRERAEAAIADLQSSLTESEQVLPELHVRANRYAEQLRELENELTSLRRRPTKIPERNLHLRAALLDELGIAESELPFAGELLRVREQAGDWEGAIERILHGFGLSLLVPDRHYGAVSQLVDRRQLNGKLVYLRALPSQRKTVGEPGPRSLVRKVRIKDDTEFFDWLSVELRERYDYECCATLEEFRRAPRALTRNGQVKSGRVRHVKDDRYAIDDRRRYILGWDNREKITALEREHATTTAAAERVQAELRQWQQRRRADQDRIATLRDILRFDEFAELHYQESVARLEELRAEQEQLEAGSDHLRELQEQLRALETEINDRDRELSENIGKGGGLRTQVVQTANEIFRLLTEQALPAPRPELNADGLPADMDQLYRAFAQCELPAADPSDGLQKWLSKAEVAADADAETLHRTQEKLLQQLTGSRGTLHKQRDAAGRLERTIVVQMQKFRNQYPEESRDIDADIQSIPAFRKLHQRLAQDDIPRHEERFRDLLRKGAIRGILSFKTKLEDHEREIREKIERINRHLHEIDYNEGTFIRITSEPVKTDDIMGFKQDLRACLMNIYGEDEDLYTEEKFAQVKKLLDRFRSDQAEDLRWTSTVTDVRRWFAFGADERYRDQDESKEYYSDSAGKSGGQKEKLAYTILASALAFQFGLEWGRARDRSFRFVVIDEAFGRGSDESTRYGLELFKRLNLQLLIVTPLQKINVIEDYIDHVHYVSNPTGRASLVRNITKQEYLEEKAAYLAEQARNR